MTLPAHRRAQRGNALVFALLALVVSAVTLGFGINYYREAQRLESIQSVSTEVTRIIGAAQATDGTLGYVGLTTATAVGGGTIPRNRATSTSTAVNRFSGAITLSDNNASTVGTALLSYANVPQDQCKDIVMGTHALARRVQVAAADVKPLDGTLSVATLNAQCLRATAVTITWVLGRS